MKLAKKTSVSIKSKTATKKTVAKKKAIPAKKKVVTKTKRPRFDIEPEPAASLVPTPKPEEIVARRFMPPVMTPQCHPGSPIPGPYCPVITRGKVINAFKIGEETKEVSPGTKIKLPIFAQRTVEGTKEFWVKVIKGNELNGVGQVVHSIPEVPDGSYVRYTGGSKSGPPRLLNFLTVEDLATI